MSRVLGVGCWVLVMAMLASHAQGQEAAGKPKPSAIQPTVTGLPDRQDVTDQESGDHRHPIGLWRPGVRLLSRLSHDPPTSDEHFVLTVEADGNRVRAELK